MRRRRSQGLRWVLLMSFSTALACGPPAEITTGPGPVRDEERPFYPSPFDGYPERVSTETRREIESAHLGLVTSGDVESARVTTRALLARDPELAPAVVLESQVRRFEGRSDLAMHSLEPVLERLPGYLAANLVYARSAEDQDRVVEAFSVYRRTAARSAASAARAELLRERAVEVQGRRVDDALARGRVDLARSELERLIEWEPESIPTLERSLDLARADEDFPSQLALVRQLAELEPDDVFRRSELGRLEMRGGDASRALEIFRKLHAEHPDDLGFAEDLDRSKFIWRLRNLPPVVAETVAVPELSRADYAVLLYWLVPGVRVAGGAQPRIATDILDHPRRQEIMRVVNVDLMSIDPSVREFQPDRPVRRVDALRSLLRNLSRQQPPAACVAETASMVAWDTVCEAAARCGLLPSPTDCLPSAPLSGREALEWIRRASSF